MPTTAANNSVIFFSLPAPATQFYLQMWYFVAQVTLIHLIEILNGHAYARFVSCVNYNNFIAKLIMIFEDFFFMLRKLVFFLIIKKNQNVTNCSVLYEYNQSKITCVRCCLVVCIIVYGGGECMCACDEVRC